MNYLKFNEYQNAARRTAIYPNKGRNIFYPVLGLMNEISELDQKIFSKEFYVSQIHGEAGDVLWYVSNVVSEMGGSLDKIFYETTDTFNEYQQEFMLQNTYFKEEQNFRVILLMKHMLKTAGLIAGIVKKAHRDNNDTLTVGAKIRIEVCLANIVNDLAMVLSLHAVSFDYVAKMNLRKLKDRQERGVLQGSGDNR